MTDTIAVGATSLDFPKAEKPRLACHVIVAIGCLRVVGAWRFKTIVVMCTISEAPMNILSPGMRE
jgi:hypothetical protein